MVLQLKDLIAKAESKGIKAKEEHNLHFLKPWQEESILLPSDNTVTIKSSLKETNTQNKAGKEQESSHYQPKSDNKLATEPATNWQQSGNKSDNKLATKWQQKKESGNKVATEPATKVATKWQQTDNKVATNRLFSVLSGLQRILVIFIYNECKISRSSKTENLTLEYISASINHKKNSIKTTLQRLEAKKYIHRVEYKNGRGGWSKYALEESLFKNMLQYETGNKLATNWQQNAPKVATEPATEPTTSSPSSSSNINTTTTTELPEEWMKIDISSLEHIGFSKSHLIQLFKKGEGNPESIQDSIEFFSFDLSENNKSAEIKKSSLAYFMGILNHSGVYAAPENYVSAKDRAMRIYIKQKKEIQEKKQEMENEIFHLSFSEWKSALSEEEKNNLLPENVKQINLSGAKESHLKKYFRENFWSIERLKKLMEVGQTIQS